MEHPIDMCPTLQEIESEHWSNRAESRAIYGLAIRICLQCASSSRWLSTAESAIPSATVPTTTTIESATSRPDEAVNNKQSGVPTKYELQQYAVPTKHERHYPQPQDTNRITNKHYEPFTISWVRQSTLTNNFESKGECECKSRLTDTDFEPEADLQVPKEKFVPLLFPTRTPIVRKPETDEELLRMFRKVEINIPLLDAIKQISKYAKFLKELCMHKRKKMKGEVELGGIVSALTRNGEFTAGAQQALPKKCQDPRIFSIPCTIGDCTFVDAMLDIGALINVMPTSIYKSFNFGDLEPTR
ncbi:hypothetical protein CR513_41559, partial [Mucuna pruriens]